MESTRIDLASKRELGCDNWTAQWQKPLPMRLVISKMFLALGVSWLKRRDEAENLWSAMGKTQALILQENGNSFAQNHAPMCLGRSAMLPRAYSLCTCLPGPLRAPPPCAEVWLVLIIKVSKRKHFSCLPKTYFFQPGNASDGPA